MLTAYGDRIRLRTNERNLFFATACNQGAEMARGEYLVFLNNDTVPLRGWLDALVRHAETHQRAGLVAGKLLYPNGTVQHAGMAICQDGWPRLIYVGFPADHPAVSRSRRMQVVSGACNLVPRTLFFQAGGFDPSYVNGFEDVDLCLRLGELGYEVYFCHESVLFHLESVSEDRFAFECQNAAVFLRRWAGKVHPDDLQIYFADGLIRIHYRANFLEFQVSPELGAVTSPQDTAEVSSLLAVRAQQVYSLLRENVALRAGGPGTLAERSA
jgi:GT2 family glycosyltransferase